MVLSRVKLSHATNRGVIVIRCTVSYGTNPDKKTDLQLSILLHIYLFCGMFTFNIFIKKKQLSPLAYITFG